jgi:hypothetical protein
MEANKEYAVFIHYGIPVIARVNSSLYKKLMSMRKHYFTGNLVDCEEFADNIVATTESEA